MTVRANNIAFFNFCPQRLPSRAEHGSDTAALLCRVTMMQVEGTRGKLVAATRTAARSLVLAQPRPLGCNHLLVAVKVILFVSRVVTLALFPVLLGAVHTLNVTQHFRFAMRAPCGSRTRFIQLGGLTVFRLTLRCGAVPAGLEPAISTLTGWRLVRLGHETRCTRWESNPQARASEARRFASFRHSCVVLQDVVLQEARGGGRTRSRRLTKTVHRRLCYSSIQWTAWESNPPRDACKAPSLPGAYPARSVLATPAGIEPASPRSKRGLLPLDERASVHREGIEPPTCRLRAGCSAD